MPGLLQAPPERFGKTRYLIAAVAEFLGSGGRSSCLINSLFPQAAAHKIFQSFCGDDFLWGFTGLFSFAGTAVLAQATAGPQPDVVWAALGNGLVLTASRALSISFE